VDAEEAVVEDDEAGGPPPQEVQMIHRAASPVVLAQGT